MTIKIFRLFKFLDITLILNKNFLLENLQSITRFNSNIKRLNQARQFQYQFHLLLHPIAKFASNIQQIDYAI